MALVYIQYYLALHTIPTWTKWRDCRPLATVVHVQIPPYIHDCWVAEESGSMRDRPISPHRSPSLVQHLKFRPAYASFALRRRRTNPSDQVVVCYGNAFYKNGLSGLGSQPCLGKYTPLLRNRDPQHPRDDNLLTLMFSCTIPLNGPTATRPISF